MEKVSVIIPVYKAENTIVRCIESLVENDYPNSEIILVIDNSPDNSLEICKSYASRNQGIIVICNENNCGVSHTRNVGLDHATGKYIMFVDSDDYVDQRYISTMVSAMQYRGTMLGLCGYVNHDEVFNGRTDYFCPQNGYGVIAAEWLENLYSSRMLQQLWNKIFWGDIIKQRHIRFDESISMGEDFRFILDYLEQLSEPIITMLDRPLYHYIRDNPNSLMSRYGNEDPRGPLADLERMYALCNLNEVEIREKMQQQRDYTYSLYSYKIMHNKTYSLHEKYRRIRELEDISHSKFFMNQLVLTVKEQIVKLIPGRKK